MKVKSGIYILYVTPRPSKMGLTCVFVRRGGGSGGGWRGVNLGKVTKNCMTITKSTFWGQTTGGYGCSGGLVPSPSPLTRGNPV